jgi:integrase
MPKLTKKLVEGLQPPAAGQAIHWDSDLRGFGVRVLPSGLKTFIVQYRAADTTSRRIALGRHGVIAPEEARRQARLLMADVQRGGDPVQERKEVRHAPALTDLVERYLSEHAEVRKKPRSVAEDKRLLDKHILPALGKRKLAEIGRAEVTRLHHSLRATPYQANRTLALVSKLFNLAERWGLRPDGSNPCRHVERFKEGKRERFLSGEELGRLGKVLAEAERFAVELPGAIGAIRLLLFTGCRLSEVLDLRWQEVDLERACLRLPDSKTGAKVIYLNGPALGVLAGLERVEGNPYVILGKRKGERLNDLEAPWRRLRAAAGLPDVRLHDLRHSFASVGAGARLGLVLIGKLLGHTQAQTTARYSHLAADPMLQASEIIGQRIAAALEGRKAKVRKLEKRVRGMKGAGK